MIYRLIDINVLLSCSLHIILDCRFVFYECASMKLDDKVTFPLVGLSVGRHLYDLYACVCHFGGKLIETLKVINLFFIIILRILL